MNVRHIAVLMRELKEIFPEAFTRGRTRRPFARRTSAMATCPAGSSACGCAPTGGSCRRGTFPELNAHMLEDGYMYVHLRRALRQARLAQGRNVRRCDPGRRAEQGSSLRVAVALLHPDDTGDAPALGRCGGGGGGEGPAKADAREEKELCKKENAVKEKAERAEKVEKAKADKVWYEARCKAARTNSSKLR